MVLEEQEESSREEDAEEEEEMVRDMVLVFFCTLWTCAMFQALQEAVTGCFGLCPLVSQQARKKQKQDTMTDVLIPQEV